MRLGRIPTSLLFFVLAGCSEPGEDGDRLRDLRACDMQPVCASVSSACGEDGQPCAYDQAAICTLEGLRDHTSGLYRQIDCEGACSGEFVYIAGPESPVRRQSYYVEYAGSSQIETLGDIEECVLRADAPAFFQACLDTPDSLTCLSAAQWVMDCVPSEHPNCA